MKEKCPWRSMWLHPRETIRRMMESPWRISFWMLVSIYGLLSLLNFFQSLALGESIPLSILLIFGVILSPVWGIVLTSVWSWIVHFTGRWLGGTGSFSNVRLSFVWACVPFSVSLILWIFMIGIFKGALFAQIPSYLLSNTQIAFLLTVLTIKVAMAIWAIILYIQGLCVIQNFSVLRTIGNLALSWIISILIIVSLRFCLFLFLQS